MEKQKLRAGLTAPLAEPKHRDCSCPRPQVRRWLMGISQVKKSSHLPTVFNTQLGNCHRRWHRGWDGKLSVPLQRKCWETLSLQNPPATTDFQAPLVPVTALLVRTQLPSGFFFQKGRKRRTFWWVTQLFLCFRWAALITSYWPIGVTFPFEMAHSCSAAFLFTHILLPCVNTC